MHTLLFLMQASHIVMDYTKANGPSSEDALQRLMLSVGGYVIG